MGKLEHLLQEQAFHDVIEDVHRLQKRGATSQVPELVAASEDSESENDCAETTGIPPTTKTCEHSLLPVRNRRVNFSFVEIRVYSITIGDHPLASLYPVTLDWSYNKLSAKTIEEHEAEATTRRTSRDLEKASFKSGMRAPRLSPAARVARLVEVSGKSGQELYNIEQKRLIFQREQRLAQSRNQRFL